ncbi:MAG: type II secretion system F family protein [Candidatus Omnitrophica bacterium]|nr:type II secretion system F family protein [Candidatus Omnitrophota bacterium]
MAMYNYKARDNNGRLVKGAMEAASKNELVEKLRKMGYMVTGVSEATTGFKLESVFENLKRIKSDDMLMFYIQLSNMINAGITILMSLSTLGKQVDNKALRDTIDGVARQVEGGSTLSDSLAAHGKVFPKLFVNMVKAGEASGNLDSVLMRYAKFYENQEDIKEKIKGALFYPIILFSFGMAVMLFLVTFVIPQFVQIYVKTGVELPMPTLIVYNIGFVVKHYWYWLVISVIALYIIVKLYSRTERGGLFIDGLKLNLPIVGPLYRKVSIARFTRTLSTLLTSGVPILTSLDITKNVAGNKILENIIANVRRYVEKGEKLAEPLKVSGEFPPDVVQMISIGEESGGLDAMLEKIADFYDMTVSYAVKKLTTIIEPLFLMVMGVMVGVIMASMLLPMFDMVKTLRH